MAYFIGIEGGGTKFVCAYGSGPHDLQDRTVIPTQTPDLTLRALIEYIRAVQTKVDIAAIGASVFGPLDLDRSSPTYGYITSTPKRAWINFDFIGALKSEFNCPVGFDTDVNAAALSEYRWGNAQQISDVLYLTVGTGIGGGVIANHELVHGAMHPEMGHILIPQEAHDTFAGICPYHGRCLEGLASGPALKERWQVKSALDLPADHPGWELEAHYLGLALANYTMTLSPKRIVIGGGVMRQEHLLPKIRRQLIQQLGGYIQNPTVTKDLEQYVVKPGLAENAGVLGAIAVAQAALAQENKTDKIWVRPWGTYVTLRLENNYQVKLLTINPGGQLSLQKHFKRAEHWVVVAGSPTLTVNGETKVYHVNESVYIPREALHRIENFGADPVKIIEVQVGDYLGEDDIVRIEDIYGRN